MECFDPQAVGTALATLYPQSAEAARKLSGLSAPWPAGTARLKEQLERSLRQAYRARALAVHPDRAAVIGRGEAELAAEFKEVGGAYELLRSFLECADALLAPPGSLEAEPAAPPVDPFADDTFHRGALPARRLRFAEYLYYRGLVGHRRLTHALAWQYRSRPRFGEIGRELRYFDHQAVLAVIRAGRVGPERFGDTALRMGLLDVYRQHVILGRQRGYAAPIGKYFTDEGLFGAARLEALLAEHRAHNQGCS